ncbi:MAG: hypothetical protein V4653_10665, partial [Pseudomonadota bacterium]
MTEQLRQIREAAAAAIVPPLARRLELLQRLAPNDPARGSRASLQPIADAALAAGLRALATHFRGDPGVELLGRGIQVIA